MDPHIDTGDVVFVTEEGRSPSPGTRYGVVTADGCVEPANCPAPHDGLVTKGDADGTYDQVAPTESTVVRPRWVIGTAELGWVRPSRQRNVDCSPPGSRGTNVR